MLQIKSSSHLCEVSPVGRRHQTILAGGRAVVT